MLSALLLLPWAVLSSTPQRPSPRLLSAEEQNTLHSQLLSEGYARVRALLPEGQAEQWGARVLAASQQQTAACPHSSTQAAPGCSGFRGASFTRGRSLEDADPLLLQLSHSPQLARLAAQAMNVTRVRLYQATSFVKGPGDAPSAWHQDAAACPLHTDKIVTLWLALGAVPPESGPLIFARRSHLPGVPIPSLRDLAPPARLARMTRWTTAEVRNSTGLPITRPLGLAAGDATLHLGWTLHAAPPNASPLPRTAMAITFFADGARVHPELLELSEPLAAAALDADGQQRGVAFRGEDGRELRVRLLDDDAATWRPWLEKKPAILVPGAVVRDSVLTPMLYDAMWDSTPSIPL